MKLASIVGIFLCSWARGCLILTIDDGHPVKCVIYAPEVEHDKTNRKDEDIQEVEYTGFFEDETLALA